MTKKQKARYGKKWRKLNKDKTRGYCKKYRKENKEKLQQYGKEYRKKNKEKIQQHKKECRRKLRQYKEKNIRESEKKRQEIYRQYLNRDPNYNRDRLNSNIAKGINSSLKGRKDGRHWEDCVGYTLKQLIKHLEKQFGEGMNWENYGAWHIDHKIPQSIFNFTKIEHIDFKRCWALSNLQPLWALDNLKKGDRITKPFQLCLPVG